MITVMVMTMMMGLLRMVMMAMMMIRMTIKMTIMMTTVQPEPAQICRAMRCCEEVRPGQINIIIIMMKL